VHTILNSITLAPKKNMRFSVTLILALLLSVPSFGQFPLLGFGSKHFDNMEGKTLSVIVSGNSVMDENLRSSFSEHWNFSKVEFISPEEMAHSITDENKYFFLSVNVSTTTEGQVLNSTRTNKYLIITRGGYKSIDKVDKRKWLFALPMDFFNDEQMIPDMSYRIEPCIKLMNDAMTTIRNEKIKIKSGPDGVKFMSNEFSKNFSRLKDKTLLINKSMVRREDASYLDLSVRHRKSATEAEIREVYPYAIEVVDKSEIESAISKNRKESAVLISLSFVNQITMIFDTETLETLYYTFNKSGLSLNKKDYKKFPL